MKDKIIQIAIDREILYGLSERGNLYCREDDKWNLITVSPIFNEPEAEKEQDILIGDEVVILRCDGHPNITGWVGIVKCQYVNKTYLVQVGSMDNCVCEKISLLHKQARVDLSVVEENKQLKQKIREMEENQE